MKTFLLPENLIRLFENNRVVGWAVKERNSNFVYVNNAFEIWQTLSTSCDYEGLKNNHTPVPGPLRTVPPDMFMLTNATALVEYCYYIGWDNYIPPFFLKKGHMLMV